MANTGNTFWDIISEYRIEIPQLQRDYAHGRETTAINQIRTSLITEILESLSSGKKLVLNFIYGEREQDLFVPIDGQQRLTTLFLVHWYIFKRVENKEGLNTLAKFSYKTRNSSQRFCKRLIEINIDFSQESIGKQIENAFWYSGSFTNDPTIKSMIVVVDEIHNQFKKISNFSVVNETIISPDCPITFLWLPMDNFQKRDDLYIKMNARGKLLTDFEIFKAKLQGSDILNGLFGGSATNAQRLEFISKFNNEYAELFYSYHKGKFDDAMMSFVQATIRDEYFAYVCEVGVTQKEYRDHYKELVGMNGSVFFNLVENGGFNFSKCNAVCGKEVFVKAIKKIDTLLSLLYENNDKLSSVPVLSRRHYNDLLLFKTNVKEGTDAENFAKFATYEYLYKFGFPDSQDSQSAYSMWKRFVFNTITNTDVAGHVEYICDAMVVVKQIVSSINQATETDVLRSISSYNGQEHISGIKYQLEEEKLKAALMLADQQWRRIILEVEDYYHDGQIGFLIEYSKRETGQPDIDVFKRGFSISKRVFDENKMIKTPCDSVLFEKALLAMEDNTTNHTAHLIKQSNSTTSWGFCCKNYKKLLSNNIVFQKKEIVFELFDLLPGKEDINIELQNAINNAPAIRYNDSSLWKRYFVENNLFDIHMQYAPTGFLTFNNCINLGKNNNEVLMLVGTTVRSYSMELKTLLLYNDLINKGVLHNHMMLHLDTTGDVIDNGYPRRYIEWDHKRIAFVGKKLDSDEYSVMYPDGTIQPLNYNGVLSLFGKS